MNNYWHHHCSTGEERGAGGEVAGEDGDEDGANRCGVEERDAIERHDSTEHFRSA